MYGHVIASNPLGEIYISPMASIIQQIKNELGAEEVILPEPLSAITKLTCHHMAQESDGAFHLLEELNNLIGCTSRTSISRRDARCWERSAERKTLSSLASITLSRIKELDPERSQILRTFIIRGELVPSSFRDATPPGDIQPHRSPFESQRPGAGLPSPPPSPSRPGEPSLPREEGIYPDWDALSTQPDLSKQRLSFPHQHVASPSIKKPLLEGSGRPDGSGLEADPPSVNKTLAYAQETPHRPRSRRNSLEEDMFYHEVMSSRPTKPPSYETAMKAVICKQRARGYQESPAEYGSKVEPPPEYRCDINLAGTFMQKMEIENVTKRAEYRNWRMVYAELHGTAFTLYNVKKERGWWAKNNQGPDFHPDSPPWVKKGSVEKVYSLSHGDVGIAADYKK